MGNNDSGGRRLPPLPVGYRQAARPPPTPAERARGNTPSPIPPTDASSGPKPAPERPAAISFRELFGLQAYAKLVTAIRILCKSCQISIEDFKTVGDSLFFRRAKAAGIEHGEMRIPLALFGPEEDVYASIYPEIREGRLPAPSLPDLPQVPKGIFMRVSAAGLELACENPEVPTTFPRVMVDRLRNVLHLIGSADAGIAGSMSLEGDSIMIKREGHKSELASATASAEGGREMRIFLEDLGWYSEVADTDAVKRGKTDATIMVASENKIRALFCGRSVPGAVMGILTYTRHVFIKVTNNGVFIAAASSRKDGRPLIEVPLPLR
ncbi:MAG: hypothetical protein PHQ80_04205 [Candidatus ainarchaeum sp.]|nr:hypothetical protein [Candidatus ainarchaeum sp.]MDD5096638.1 hypothetical protein [Candidatus ainarchaeum sp.]